MVPKQGKRNSPHRCVWYLPLCWFVWILPTPNSHCQHLYLCLSVWVVAGPVLWWIPIVSRSICEPYLILLICFKNVKREQKTEKRGESKNTRSPTLSLFLERNKTEFLLLLKGTWDATYYYPPTIVVVCVCVCVGACLCLCVCFVGVFFKLTGKCQMWQLYILYFFKNKARIWHWLWISDSSVAEAALVGDSGLYWCDVTSSAYLDLRTFRWSQSLPA